ncbi:MAG: site-2 protease family protein, partial [Chloroflexota bacterium]
NLLVDGEDRFFVIRLLRDSGYFFFGEGELLLSILLEFAYINVLLFVFNLIPIPPLDGSHILFALLPGDNRQAQAILSQFGLFMLLFVVFSAPEIIHGPTDAFFNGLMNLVVLS